MSSETKKDIESEPRLPEIEFGTKDKIIASVALLAVVAGIGAIGWNQIQNSEKKVKKADKFTELVVEQGATVPMPNIPANNSSTYAAGEWVPVPSPEAVIAKSEDVAIGSKFHGYIKENDQVVRLDLANGIDDHLNEIQEVGLTRDINGGTGALYQDLKLSQVQNRTIHVATNKQGLDARARLVCLNERCTMQIEMPKDIDRSDTSIYVSFSPEK